MGSSQNVFYADIYLYTNEGDRVLTDSAWNHIAVAIG